jgi:hypothetical protein
MLRKCAFVLLVLAAACRRNPEESAVSQPEPPPAAALAVQGKSLDANLRDLEVELSKALGSGIDKSGEEHMLRAEAITDRLLEVELPYTWLRATNYSLEGYVRQIQALADRIVAELRSGTDRGTVMQDATLLRREVIGLRRNLAMGGEKAPVPLDSLLAGMVADSTLPTDAGE